jgi:hypothetical protein
MRKIITISLFLFFTQIVFGQVVKFKSTGVAVTVKDKITQEWNDWSEMRAAEVLIVLDVDNDRIKIYSNEEQTYDVIDSEEPSTDSDGDFTIGFICINEDGLKCRVRLVTLYSQNNQEQLYVDFGDTKFVYNIYTLE